MKKTTYIIIIGIVLIQKLCYAYVDNTKDCIHCFLKNSILQKEIPVYTATRFALQHKADQVFEYELTDHLGNVRVIINNKMLKIF